MRRRRERRTCRGCPPRSLRLARSTCSSTRTSTTRRGSRARASPSSSTSTPAHRTVLRWRRTRRSPGRRPAISVMRCAAPGRAERCRSSISNSCAPIRCRYSWWTRQPGSTGDTGGEPLGRTGSGCGFDRAPGLLLLELRGAEVAERGMYGVDATGSEQLAIDTGRDGDHGRNDERGPEMDAAARAQASALPPRVAESVSYVLG